MNCRTSSTGLAGCCHRAKSFFLILVFFAGIFLIGAIPAQSGSPSLFTWGAFQHFWNKNALPGTELQDSLKVDEGYMVILGFSASVTAHIRRGMVDAIQIQYNAAPGQEAGGPRFLKGIETAIRVGSFGWPPERVAAARKTFEFMSPQLKTYRWKNSRFSRFQNSVGTWIFKLEFINDDDSIE